MPWLAWDEAWEAALFGSGGFFTRSEGPAAHFRTASSAAAPLLAAALLRLARESGCTAVVDVGAGRGELLAALAAEADRSEHAGPRRVRLHGVDVVSRPAALPPRVGWTRARWGAGSTSADLFDGALVLAWELLDTVPCAVVQADPRGVPRAVLVDPATGQERLAGAASGADLEWCRRWWPVQGRPGARAEVGSGRDALWALLVARSAATAAGSLLVAVDYAHTRADRPPGGSLAGYRAGRAVQPVPDASCDVTASVALDAVAAAGRDAGATGTLCTSQREALRALGVTGRTAGTAGASGPEVLAALQRAGQEAELLDPGGLGGFTWLVQAAGRPMPGLPLGAAAGS